MITDTPTDGGVLPIMAKVRDMLVRDACITTTLYYLEHPLYVLTCLVRDTRRISLVSGQANHTLCDISHI